MNNEIHSGDIHDMTDALHKERKQGMTQIEQIKAEIERMKDETCIGISEYDKGVENGRMEVLNSLLKLINSFPKEGGEG